MKPINRIRRSLGLTLAGVALGFSSIACAQGDMTRLVVAFPPGGPVDFVARVLADQLSKELGHNVIVENKAGANGIIAAQHVSRSAPDARTLWLTSVGAVAINPALYPNLPYDPTKDLTPVSLVVNNVEMLVVNADAPYDTGAEFVEFARRGGEQPTMASSGTGSVPHLAMELLNESADIKLRHIPYKGASPAITDVIAGHVNGFFGDIPGLIGHINAGKLKPIGVAATKRHPRFPEVKTFAEMGFEGVDSDNWYAVFAAKGTPSTEADRVSEAVRRALADPAVKEKLEASGAETAGSTPAELSEVLARDIDKWTKVIRANDITVE